MTADLSLAGQLLAMAFASGLNLYATVAVLGIASRFGWIAAMPPGLHGVQDPIVIASATLLFLVEFAIDKVPHLDSLWDTIHTFIRPTAAALLALAAVSGSSLPLGIIAATPLLAGGIALAAHGAKAGLRLSIHTAPGSIAITTISLAEDAVAIGIAIAALVYPPAALAILAVTLAAIAIFAPRLSRAFVLGMRAIAARLRGFFGLAGWRGTDELPRRLRALVRPPPLGGPAHRATRACLYGPRPIGAFRNGWLVVTRDDVRFLFRSLLGARSIQLTPIHSVRVRHGALTNALDLETERFRCTLFLLKDGPPPDLIFADFAPAAP